MSIHEVTRAQFKLVCAELSPAALDVDSENEAFTDRESGQLPVTSVSWFAAKEFCQQLSSLPSEQSAGRRYRLPTEAEWEYACRRGGIPSQAGSTGQSPDQSTAKNGVGSPLPIQPVGSSAPDACGLFDMRGNAWEWTEDWYARDYYLHSPRRNPAGPDRGDLKVVRGSEWRFSGEACHLDAAVMPPWKVNPVVGFRVICEQGSISRPENAAQLDSASR